MSRVNVTFAENDNLMYTMKDSLLTIDFEMDDVDLTVEIMGAGFEGNLDGLFWYAKSIYYANLTDHEWGLRLKTFMDIYDDVDWLPYLKEADFTSKVWRMSVLTSDTPKQFLNRIFFMEICRLNGKPVTAKDMVDYRSIM